MNKTPAQTFDLADMAFDLLALRYKPEHVALVVRAVNCHEELIRTLKLVQSGRHCMADINEAIAKAERK